MYISLNWIKDYVDLEGIDIMNLINNRFTLAVAEVEGVEVKGENISGIVTAKIVSVADHPNSKKLHLLKVDKGDEVVDIVCGAPNVREGMIIPLATLGARIGDITIGTATLGGCVSNGMCCSAKELGISDDHSGLYEFSADTKIGVDVKSILPIDDIVFEIDNKSLTNRPDLWGHYGIAREIAALVHRPLKRLDLCEEDTSKLPKLDISVTSDTCFRYTSATMDNITKTHSPMEMQIRLYYTGMRGINMLADVTNYVMLELGQPMHAFNNALVKSIQVDNVTTDTEFVTLDNEKRVLPKDTMVIKGNGEISAIAGIMGGLDSEITLDTTSVLIESACFESAKVRKTATALGLRTEASSRYEKSLDPELTLTALKRYMYLVKSIDSGANITSSITDVYNYHYPTKVVEITKEYIDNYAGKTFEEKDIVDTLRALEFEVEGNSKGYKVTVPTFRATKDIQGRPDLVEEIARIYGYDNIEPKSCNMEVLPVDLKKSIDAEYNIKYTLATKYNLSEIHTYLWYDYETNKELNIHPASHLKIINSLQKDNDELRSTLIPSQLKVVMDNKADYSSFGVFEIGSAVIGMDKNNLAIEHKKLCITLYNKVDDVTRLLDLKEMLEYVCSEIVQIPVTFVPGTPVEEYMSPVNYYDIVCNGKTIGSIGAIHPKTLKYIDRKCGVYTLEIDFNDLVAEDTVASKFEKVSKYPKSELDFNFVIDKSMLYREVEAIATSLDTKINYNVSLLDIFEMEDSKSYTLHYNIWSNERTLTGGEIESFHALVIDTFKSKGINLKM